MVVSSQAVPPDLSPVSRVLRLARLERADITLVVLYAAFASVAALVVPIVVQTLVNTVAFGTLLQPILVLALLVAAALSTAALFRALSAVVVERIQQRLFARTALQAARVLPRVRLSEGVAPDFVNRFFDVLTMQKSAATLLVDGTAWLLQTAVGVVLLGLYHPYFLAFDFLMIAGFAFVLFGLGRGAVKTSIAESYAKYDVAAWLEQMVTHPTMFHGRGGVNFATRRARLLTRTYLNARRKHFRILFRQIVSSLGFQVLASCALVVVGGMLVINRQLTLGQLVAAELIVSGLLNTFSKVGKQLESYYDLTAAVDKVEHLLELPTEDARQGTFHQHEGPLSVVFSNMSFSHATEPVFEKINLTIAAGERIGIVGPNGSGKSTLIDLIYGLRDPSAGHIEIGGEPLQTLAYDELRSHVGLSRGAEIFEGTVEENVTAGRETISRAQVREALAAADLWDDVRTWPEGIDTRLLESGRQLSLGQNRKLAIARALCASPRLLLLDESLDDLDPHARELALDSIFDPSRPWTVVLVSHDPKTLARCSRVMTLHNHTLVEQTALLLADATAPQAGSHGESAR